MKDTIQIHAIGSQVGLTLNGSMTKPWKNEPVLGLIIAAIIEMDAIRYRVAYWDGGRRREAIVSDIEILLHNQERMTSTVRKKKVPA